MNVNHPSGSLVYTNSDSNYLTIGSSQTWPSRLVIHMNGNTPAVSFESDGTVTFGEAYTISEVAKRVWEGFAACNPMHGEVDRLKQEVESLKRRLSESELRGSNT